MRAALGPTQNWDVVFDQICYEAPDARAICGILAGRVGHYVFTSSQAVYGPGASIVEEVFNPLEHPFARDALTTKDYPEAKRQCETVFFVQNVFPVTAVRFPIVAGIDDYTGRLQWHLDRVRNGEPLYFPNLNARLSLIHSDDAARVLAGLAGSVPLGPLNAAAREPLRLASLVAEVERVGGRKALILSDPQEGARSPYGIERDWLMDVQKLALVGFRPRPVAEWLRASLA